MLIYYCLLIISVAAGIILCRNKAGKIAYCVLMGVAFFVIAAIRYDVGFDYALYSSVYDRMNFLRINDLNSHIMEKGFVYVMKFLTYITPDVQLLFVLIGLVIAVGIMIYVCKNSEKPWVGVTSFIAFGLFFNSLCFMRQFIAAIIIMYALKYVVSNRFFSFLLLVLFASTIHVSALLMIPFYFILKIKMDWAVLAIYTIIGATGYILSWDILSFVTKYFYTQYDPATSKHIQVGLPLVFVFAYGIIFIVAFLLRKPLVKRNPFNNVLINCIFFATFFEFIGSKHSIISRIALLFLIPPILILVGEMVIVLKEKIAEKFPDSRRKRTSAIACVYIALAVVSVTSFQWLLSTNNNGVVPYQTISSREEKPPLYEIRTEAPSQTTAE